MYSFFKSLILPPASLIVLLAAAVLALAFRWRKLGFGLATIGLIAFYVLSTPYGAGHLANAVQSAVPLEETALAENPPGAIVILSSGLLPRAPEYSGRHAVDAATLQRLAYGAYLWRRFYIPILVTGGAAPGARDAVAPYMRDVLSNNFGVPTTWVEDKARNTLENAQFSAAILHDAGVNRVLLVTHAAHMPRALRFFTLAGLDVLPAPTVFTAVEDDFPSAFRPRMGALEDSSFAIYELLGSLWYRMTDVDYAAATATH